MGNKTYHRSPTWQVPSRLREAVACPSSSIWSGWRSSSIHTRGSACLDGRRQALGVGRGGEGNFILRAGGRLCRMPAAAPRGNTHHLPGHGPTLHNVSSQPEPTAALRATTGEGALLLQSQTGSHGEPRVDPQPVCQPDGGHHPRAKSGLPVQCRCLLLSQTSSSGRQLRSPAAEEADKGSHSPLSSHYPLHVRASKEYCFWKQAG